MVLVSVFTMIASSIAPATLLGDDAGDPLAGGAGADMVEERVATISDAGNAFAALSVLSVKVDGREVLEDAWGQGTLDELSFKVGVKPADGRTLRLGDDDVKLSPTDVITIRDFRGRFAFKDLGTTLATIQLDGTVQTTLVAEGEVTSKVTTRLLDDPDRRLAAPDPVTHDLAYVVLDTGEKKETVEWQTGESARLLTWGADGTAEDGSDAVAVRAKWVKVDGRAITQYTWGDGAVEEITFEPTSRQSRGSLLNWSGTEHALRPGEAVVVSGFVGTYLVYEAAGGEMKLKLDGYARNMSLKMQSAASPAPNGENVPPVARIGYEPENPTTSEYVTFTDLSEDEDGLIVFREWTFGDTGRTTIGASPKHRFSTPGVHAVHLDVTDNALSNDTAVVYVTVENTPPVSDWDFKPKSVYSQERVLFNSHAWDPDDADGPRAFEWDFGDGSAPVTGAQAEHRYESPGNYTATLTVTDAHGDQNALSKVIPVNNRLPRVDFEIAQANPLTLEDVQFTDLSEDVDGTIACWHWDFGDGGISDQQNPVYQYGRPGTYTVRLRACDDHGGSATASSTLVVVNRAPSPNFTFTPEADITTGTYVQFTDTSEDRDGGITEWRWNFGDGSPVDTRKEPRHRFPTAGTFKTCLTVKDRDGGQATTCESVGVENSPPRVDFSWSPSDVNKPVANTSVVFNDLTVDPDGDALQSWEWDFGDGSPVVTERNPVHRFTRMGNYPVTLRVTDVEGRVGERIRTLEVHNALPTVSFTSTPDQPTTIDTVTFTAHANDTDGEIVAYEWDFGVSGEGLVTGNPVTKQYTSAGTYDVRLTVRDNDGGERIITRSLRIDLADPQANFTWSPVPPVPGQNVTFNLNAVTHGAEITRATWKFGDGAKAECDADACTYTGGPRDGETTPGLNPKHAYSGPGSFSVELGLRLDTGQVDGIVKSVRINAAPAGQFNVNRSNVGLGEPIRFTDASSDADGHIQSWHWDFGDGTLRDTQGPHEHTFSAPGTHTVYLTVTDNDGAQHTTSRTIGVANRAPAAAFTVTPAIPQRNTDATFTDLSRDPDAPHDRIAAWTWQIGENAPVVHASSATHRFTSSGSHTVKLAVRDTVGATSESMQRIRVSSDHDLNLALRTLLPDGRTLDHALENVNLTVTLDRPAPFQDVTYHRGVTGFTVQGDGSVTVTVPATAWAAGDQLRMRVVLTDDREASDTWFLDLTDAHTAISHDFRLAFPLKPTIKAKNGTTDAPVVDFKVPGAQYNTPTYRNQTERVRLEGQVTWLDGEPAEGARVDVYVKWIGFPFLTFPFLDSVHDNVRGACLIETVTAGVDGRYESEVPFTPHCLHLFGETGAMLPGWYEVWAIANYEAIDPTLFDGKQGRSPTSHFVEDPFGLLIGRVFR